MGSSGGYCSELCTLGKENKLDGSPGDAAAPRLTKDAEYAKAVSDAWASDPSIQENGPFEEKAVTYMHGDLKLYGYLVKPQKVNKGMGVILVHTAVGPHDIFLRWKAEQLAAAGYTAFIADCLGDETGLGWDGEWSVAKRKVLTDDRELLRQRMRAAVTFLAEECHFSATRMAAIGYCFGGRAVLDLARLGTDAGVAAVVSFHGILDDGVVPAKDMSAAGAPQVLICHGDADPFTKLDSRSACEEQLRKSGAKWELKLFGGTKHGFTNPAQAFNTNPSFGYDPIASSRSWTAMEVLFQEVLATLDA